MAKKEDIDKKKAATSAGEIVEIETVADLEAGFPGLVSKIEDGVALQISKSTARQVKENMPELYQRIVTDVQGKGGSAKNVPGFLLEVDDPFAEGTLRSYQTLKGIDGLRLPYVLPFKDEATKETLENYILRANGGGDTKRVNAARKAMEKCK